MRLPPLRKRPPLREEIDQERLELSDGEVDWINRTDTAVSSRRGVYASSERGTLTIRSRTRGIKVSERRLRHFGHSARSGPTPGRSP